jgi:outer membrane protein TolC
MVRTSMVPMLLACCGLAAHAPQPGPAAPAAAQVRRLSLREALQTALQFNLQVDISQQQREVARAGIPSAEGAFDWNFSADAQLQRLEAATSGFLNKNSGTVYPQTNTAYNRSLSVDLAKPFEWGGTLDLNYKPIYSYQKGTIQDYPGPGDTYTWSTQDAYTGSFAATYTQSLLQGFGTRIAKVPLVIARRNAESADYTFQLAIINLMAQVESDYWKVVSTGRILDSKKISLQLAHKLLGENLIKLKVGTMAPLDVTSAEAQVAKAEQDIITAEADLANAKDTLVRDLYPNAERPAALELTDAPTLDHIRLDEDSAVRMALERRLELKKAKADKDVKGLLLEASQDKVRPQLNAFVTYNGASDNYTALGPVNTDLAEANYPGYTVGLTFKVPLENRVAKGNLSAARANLRGSELSLRDQELSITNAVRQAVRTIDAAEKSVKAAEKTRILQEKTLEAEQKKFDNGMSTNFNVLQYMTQLDAARTAEVQAQITYATAVTQLEVAVGNLLEARNFEVK